MNLMRVVIQRVSRASVSINNKIKEEIGKGLLVFAGIEESDNETDVDWLCNKIVHLRIFNDADDIMNCSILDVGGAIMVISQFTLHAKTKKGNRPSYIRAAHPDLAVPVYNSFISRLSQLTNNEIKSGIFGAMMQIELVNDGPVTIIIDSKERE